jgi:hypothetical protein
MDTGTHTARWSHKPFFFQNKESSLRKVRLVSLFWKIKISLWDHPKMVSLLSLIWKYRSRLMTSPCCLYVWVPSGSWNVRIPLGRLIVYCLRVVYLKSLSATRNTLRRITGWWIMNWKGCERRWSCPNSRYSASICLEVLKKTTRNLKTVGIPTETLTKHLPNASQKYYGLSQCTQFKPVYNVYDTIYIYKVR